MNSRVVTVVTNVVQRRAVTKRARYVPKTTARVVLMSSGHDLVPKRRRAANANVRLLVPTVRRVATQQARRVMPIAVRRAAMRLPHPVIPIRAHHGVTMPVRRVIAMTVHHVATMQVPRVMPATVRRPVPANGRTVIARRAFAPRKMRRAVMVIVHRALAQSGGIMKASVGPSRATAARPVQRVKKAAHV